MNETSQDDVEAEMKRLRQEL
ncbi:hypothetical protein CCACVL1_29988 [Corchorus capsularis]|uniref:Uncharacterized protein n=1 Tax=Corchorus capsularis TaxID=210143 RepID=A0A1R3FZ58_COCAP|nr:hypothetical protein CCACVL1_29988 [Corchorus capsularis]